MKGREKLGELLTRCVRMPEEIFEVRPSDLSELGRARLTREVPVCHVPITGYFPRSIQRGLYGAAWVLGRNKEWCIYIFAGPSPRSAVPLGDRLLAHIRETTDWMLEIPPSAVERVLDDLSDLGHAILRCSREEVARDLSTRMAQARLLSVRLFEPADEREKADVEEDACLPFER